MNHPRVQNKEEVLAGRDCALFVTGVGKNLLCSFFHSSYFSRFMDPPIVHPKPTHHINCSSNDGVRSGSASRSTLVY
jgi:hypothetical protein